MDAAGVVETPRGRNLFKLTNEQWV
jgi:hypothetical protein